MLFQLFIFFFFPDCVVWKGWLWSRVWFLVQEATSQLEQGLKRAPPVDGDYLMGWQLWLQSQIVAVDEACSAWME